MGILYSKSIVSEESPLINNDEESQLSNESKTTYKQELSFIFQKSFPLIVTFLLQYSLTVVSIYFTGKLGDYELGAGSLSITLFYITGPVIVNGFATCLDTLCSQAYGAKNYELFSLYIQRCSVTMVIALIPSCLLWWNSLHLLGIFIKDDRLLQLTSKYLRLVSFGAPALILFETSKRFLQSQNIFTATTYVLVLSVPINILLNYILIVNPSTRVGFVGAPIALILTYWLNAILLIAYILFVNGSGIWRFTGMKKVFVNWNQLLKLAVPGIIMIESESLAFQLLTFMAAKVNNNELNSQSVISTMASLGFQLPFAMAVCSSTRISQYIGAGKKREAIIATNAALFCAILAGVFNCSILLFGRGFISRIFTTNPDIQLLIMNVLPIVAIMQLIDCFNVLAAGCLRGQGRQRIGSYLSLTSYYIIAVPLEVYFCFTKGLNVNGLWVGLSVGVSFLSVSEVCAVIMTNWTDVLKSAKLRNQLE